MRMRKPRLLIKRLIDFALRNKKKNIFIDYDIISRTEIMIRRRRNVKQIKSICNGILTSKKNLIRLEKNLTYCIRKEVGDILKTIAQ